jgi:murein DD-endopeptidase MepM/ murein hydrolase activator NlpD
MKFGIRSLSFTKSVTLILLHYEICLLGDFLVILAQFSRESSEDFFMGNLAKIIGRAFGLTSRGRSLLGKVFDRAGARKIARRFAGVVILVLVGGKISLSNLAFAANIGGVPTINLTPNEAIRVETKTEVAVQLPIRVQYVSQRYSWHHSGIDLVAPTGTAVYPVMDGTVVLTDGGWLGYGHHVIVKHSLNFETLYAHLSKIDVKIGQNVGLKTKLGDSGSTGFSTGPHLHFELHQDGVTINPEELLPEVVVK